MDTDQKASLAIKMCLGMVAFTFPLSFFAGNETGFQFWCATLSVLLGIGAAISFIIYLAHRFD